MVAADPRDLTVTQLRAFILRTGAKWLDLARESGVSYGYLRQIANGAPFGLRTALKLMDAMERWPKWG